MSESPGGVQDYLYLGPESRPSDADIYDPRARVGRPQPLPEKMHGFYQGQPLPSPDLAVSNAVVRLILSDDAMSASCQVQGAAIRWTFDGSPPTAAHGFRGDPGATFVITGRESLIAFQAIREGGADGTLAAQQWM